MADTQKRDYSLHFPKEGLLGRDVDVLRFLQARHARKAAVAAVHAKNLAPREKDIIKKYIKSHQINKTEEEGLAFLETTHKGLQAIDDDLFGIGLVLKQFFELGADFYKKDGTQLSVEEIAYAEKFQKELEAVLAALRPYLDELEAAIRGKEIAEGALNIQLMKYNVSSFFHPIRNFLEWWNMRSTTKSLFKVENHLKKIEEKSKLSHEDIKHLLQYDKAFVEEISTTVKNLCIYMLILIRNADVVGNDLIKAADPHFQNFDLPERFKGFGEELVFMLNDQEDALKSLNKMRLQLQESAAKMQKALDSAQHDRRKEEVELKRAA